MAITTYTELKAAIADWLLRTDLTAVIPNFIALAEADINRSVKHWRMESQTDLAASSQYTALPSDFIEVARATAEGARPYRLELASRGDIQELRMARADTAGVPRLYAITGGDLELYPTPGEATTIDLQYIARPEALSDSNATNWLLTYHPDVYLYGALMQSAPYLKDDERLGVWVAAYRAAVEGVNIDGQRGRYGATAPRLKIRSY